jgi:hypothetical protein
MVPNDPIPKKPRFPDLESSSATRKPVLANPYTPKNVHHRPYPSSTSPLPTMHPIRHIPPSFSPRRYTLPRRMEDITRLRIGMHRRFGDLVDLPLSSLFT